MKGLPSAVNLTPLIGRFIEVLRISKYQVHYFLNDDKPNGPDVWIEIGGTITYTDDAGKTTDINDFRMNGGLLCLLLGLKVEDAFRLQDGGLGLKLATGIRLEVPIETPMYESVVLHIGAETIVG